MTRVDPDDASLAVMVVPAIRTPGSDVTHALYGFKRTAHDMIYVSACGVEVEAVAHDSAVTDGVDCSVCVDIMDREAAT